MTRNNRNSRKDREDEDYQDHSDWEWNWHHDRHHGGNFVLGAILIVAGGLFLLNALGFVVWDVWSHIWAFWPVLLILWGLHIIVDRDPILHSIMSVVTIVVLVLIAMYAVRATNPAINYHMNGLDNIFMRMGQMDRMKGSQTHLRVVQ